MRRTLATEVIVRGTVRYGAPQTVVLATSGLKQASQQGVSDIVTRTPRPRAKLGAGDVAMSVDGRPVFVLPGAILESTAMGLVGGIVGASVGTLVIVAVSAAKTWTPVLDPWVPMGAQLLGALIGLISGTYPSLRAASLEPVEALRAGT